MENNNFKFQKPTSVRNAWDQLVAFSKSSRHAFWLLMACTALFICGIVSYFIGGSSLYEIMLTVAFFLMCVFMQKIKNYMAEQGLVMGRLLHTVYILSVCFVVQQGVSLYALFNGLYDLKAFGTFINVLINIGWFIAYLLLVPRFGFKSDPARIIAYVAGGICLVLIVVARLYMRSSELVFLWFLAKGFVLTMVFVIVNRMVEAKKSEEMAKAKKSEEVIDIVDIEEVEEVQPEQDDAAAQND